MKKFLAKGLLVFMFAITLLPVVAFGEEGTSDSAVVTTTEAVAATEAAVAATTEAAAEAAPAPAPVINTGDTAWVLTASALVLLMTVPALALFYGGMVKKKNILSTMYYSFGAAILVSILWVLGQYSIAFGGKDVGGIIGGLDKMFLSGVGMSTAYATAPTIPEFVFLATE